MTADHYDGPYHLLVEMLTHPQLGGYEHALLGDLIRAKAEMNLMLARTKETMPRSLWLGLADEYEDMARIYAAAWADFLADPGPLKRAKLRQVMWRTRDAIRAVLEEMRHEMHQLMGPDPDAV